MGGEDAVEGSVEADSSRDCGRGFFSIGGCWSTGKNWHSLRRRMQFSQRPWASSAATRHRILRRRQWTTLSVEILTGTRKGPTTRDRGAMVTQLVALFVVRRGRRRGRIHGARGHGFDHGGHGSRACRERCREIRMSVSNGVKSRMNVVEGVQNESVNRECVVE